MFSRRLPSDLTPNALARARRERGDVPYDLTLSNPTACGIAYPPEILAPLGSPSGLRYEPDPRGLDVARRAIAADYRRHGLDVDPERILLVASSSEAYALLFKLTCDPGDAVLIPEPSYPLFEHLATLEGVRPDVYSLRPDSGWQPDPHELERETARAIVVVHPNNPTGSFLEPGIASALALGCARADRALVADEVFLDYPLRGPMRASLLATAHELPAYVLGGLSKSVGLPQLKLSWIVVAGPEPAARAALERLEFVADQYLSVATPVQHALPELFAAGAEVRAAILARCRANLEHLRLAVRACPAVSLVEPEGGWSAVLRCPAVGGEESLALELLVRDGVAVHPGYFFGFLGGGWLVLSLLVEPERFAGGVCLVLEAVERRAGAGPC